MLFLLSLGLGGCRLPFLKEQPRELFKTPSILFCDVPLPFFSPKSDIKEIESKYSACIEGRVDGSLDTIKNYFIRQFDQSGWRIIEQFESIGRLTLFFASWRKHCSILIEDKKDFCWISISVKSVDTETYVSTDF
jgi:hypothetical protein